MRKIWDPTSTSPQYDTEHGKSFYNMRKFGGELQFKRLDQKKYVLCNCYNLAAITQLACAILVDEFGNERVDSSWVFQCPNGFINSGPLCIRRGAPPVFGSLQVHIT